MLGEIKNRIERLGIFRVLIVVAAIASQFYFYGITTPIPNYNPNTDTILVGANDPVIPQPIRLEYAIGASALIFFIAYTFSSKEPTQDIISPDEAESIVKKRMKRLKEEDPRFLNRKVNTTDYVLRRIFLRDEPPVPNRYIFITKIYANTDEGSGEIYYRFEINPHNGRIERMFEVLKKLDETSTCRNCGDSNTTDVKYILGGEAAEFRFIIDELRKGGGRR